MRVFDLLGKAELRPLLWPLLVCLTVCTLLLATALPRMQDAIATRAAHGERGLPTAIEGDPQ